MILSNDVLHEFAKIITDQSKGEKQPTVKYGTVTRVSGDLAYVKLDGAPDGGETPALLSMDAVAGDRVSVMIKNHRAVVTGNVTAPATAQTTARYTKLTDEGLIVGELNVDGQATGLYIIIEPSRLSIRNQNGDILASFYATGETFASGAGRINVVDGVLFLIGERATGLRSYYQSGNDTIYAEVIALAAENEIPTAALQIRNTDGSLISQLKITPLGAKYNESTLLTENNVLATGVVQITRKIDSGRVGACAGVITNLPEGFTLVGISQIDILDYDTEKRSKDLNLHQFYTNPGQKKVGAYVLNTALTQKHVTVNIEWFALRVATSQTPQPIIIDLGDDTSDDDY